MFWNILYNGYNKFNRLLRILKPRGPQVGFTAGKSPDLRAVNNDLFQVKHTRYRQRRQAFRQKLVEEAGLSNPEVSQSAVIESNAAREPAIGEVLAASVESGLFDGCWKVDNPKAKTLHHLGGNIYTTPDKRIIAD